MEAAAREAASYPGEGASRQGLVGLVAAAGPCLLGLSRATCASGTRGEQVELQWEGRRGGAVSGRCPVVEAGAENDGGHWGRPFEAAGWTVAAAVAAGTAGTRTVGVPTWAICGR